MKTKTSVGRLQCDGDRRETKRATELVFTLKRYISTSHAESGKQSATTVGGFVYRQQVEAGRGVGSCACACLVKEPMERQRRYCYKQKEEYIPVSDAFRVLWQGR